MTLGWVVGKRLISSRLNRARLELESFEHRRVLPPSAARISRLSVFSGLACAPDGGRRGRDRLENCSESRRTVIKRMAYVAPIVLTLAATPAFARNGSSGGQNNENEEHRNKGKKPKKR